MRHPPPATSVEMDIWLRRLVGRFQWDGVLDLNPRNGTPDGSDLLGVKGISDCIAIGAGPGVQCVLDVRWLEKYTFEGVPEAVPSLTPAMNMFGIDSARQRMLYLQVDNRGRANGGAGTLVGSTADFRAPCIGTDLPLLSREEPGQSMVGQGEQSASGEDSGQGNTGGNDFGTADTRQTATHHSAAIGGNSGEPAPWMTCLWITRISARSDSNVIYINIAYGDRSDPTNRFTLTLRRVLNPPQERKDAERKR